MTDSQPKHLFSYRKFWAHQFGSAPQLPMTRAEMDELGWDSCDIIIVTGDAYIDHPSFGMAVTGRLLEAQGFRVGIIAQPDWNDLSSFTALGKPNLFFGVTAGNMDSLVNNYTADRKLEMMTPTPRMLSRVKDPIEQLLFIARNYVKPSKI